MAECIERDVVMKRIMAAKWMDGYDGAMAMEIAASAPAADVAPVVHCKDCEHTYESFGRLVCDHGVCKGCTVREDFFCADGVTRKENER